MTLTPTQRNLLGLATLVAVLGPFLLVPLAVGGVLFTVFGSAALDPGSVPSPEFVFPTFIFTMFPLIACTSIVQVALQIIYLILVIQDKRLTDTARVLFALGTFFVPYLAMPIYFFVYLWSKTPPGMEGSSPA